MRENAEALAAEIKKLWPKLDVQLVRGHSSTDRRIPGTRLIRPGKGRSGARIIVRDPKHPAYPRSESVLLDHNNAETYRRLSEVRDWIELRRGRPVSSWGNR